jgi:hypothetical protein
MERPRDPFDFVIGLREEMTELRVTVGHIATDVSELRQQSRPTLAGSTSGSSSCSSCSSAR